MQRLLPPTPIQIYNLGFADTKRAGRVFETRGHDYQSRWRRFDSSCTPKTTNDRLREAMGKDCPYGSQLRLFLLNLLDPHESVVSALGRLMPTRNSPVSLPLSLDQKRRGREPAVSSYKNTGTIQNVNL
ncbi:uncharacterized protein N7473_005225 [Penicillium subrubescens]|uniref:uncharacterized protein n=1 Tax=Penicillium subrubescens TaxID=1316194 RepID=UPI002545A280|nr:uncharacterized protein N7473_005225 [Penicillium subrubescens]KAJ5895826.1 hypothetical protein N7473_005225 [Penicillium subrubescens]